MKGGFTFNNVDIADVCLEYAPELTDTYIYRPATTRIHEETFDGHDGGYVYGFTKEPKEIILRCFFEQKHINQGIMEKIHWLFRKGNSGKLVFQKRPWCYYYATVTDVDDKDLKNYLNGFIKVTMKAYYPFARSDDLIYQKNKLDYFKAMECTAFLDEENMMPSTNITKDGAVTSRKTFLLYNPGNEYADVGIEIAGEAPKGVKIKNLTTNQECRFVALTDAVTTNMNRYVYYDGINGKCVLKSLSEANINSLYHDYGYINLAPGYPITRNIFVSKVNGTIVTVANFLYDETIGENIDYAKQKYVGKYIYLNSKWRKIINITDEHTLTLGESGGTNKIQKTVIVFMNELVVEPVTDMNLSRLRFNYKATFA